MIEKWFAIAVTVMGIVGCDRGSQAKAPPASVKKLEEVRGKGVLRGRVTLDGTPPVMAVISNELCHDHATPLKEETVVAGGDGALANVFVYVQGLPRVDATGFAPALLDQVNCRYVPHVLGVMVGQTLRIRSSDPTMHNVHFTPLRNEARNFGMTRAGDEKTVTFTSPEFIRFKCDVHPWMTAYVGVFDGPFFAATADDGKFEIKGLPPGKYTLIAWHELLGERKTTITVENEQSLSVEFKYGDTGGPPVPPLKRS